MRSVTDYPDIDFPLSLNFIDQYFVTVSFNYPCLCKHGAAVSAGAVVLLLPERCSC